MGKRTIVILVFLTLTMIMMSVPAVATGFGVVFNDTNFTGNVPSGYDGFSNFNGCEYNRWSSSGDNFQHIYSGNNDTCNPNTNGAPGFGDVSIRKSFSASAGQYYKGWVKAYMVAPNSSRAVVKLHFFDSPPNAGGNDLGECYGRTTNTGVTTFHSGTYGPLTKSASGGCKAPQNTQSVNATFRIHSEMQGASGQAVLRQYKFGRCEDNGNCSNVPSP